MSFLELETHWSAVRPILAVYTEADFERATTQLEQLLDEVGTDESHPLYDLLDTLGTVLHAYEETHYQVADASGAEIIKFFMEEHDLTQSDLPEIGSQGVVSEILNEKRELNVRQVRALAERFGVAPAVFL